MSWRIVARGMRGRKPECPKCGQVDVDLIGSAELSDGTRVPVCELCHEDPEQERRDAQILTERRLTRDGDVYES